jgi:integrase
MATFNFNLQQPYVKNEDGTKRLNPNETRLYMFVIHDNEHVTKLKTEHTIIPAQWDFKKKLIKHQIAGATQKNKLLSELRSNISEEYDKLRKEFPNMKWDELSYNLKEFIDKKVSPIYSDRNKPFFTVFDEFVDFKKNNVSDLTIRKYQTLKTSLLEFKPRVTFDSIDQKFYTDYVNCLRIKEPTGRQKTREEHQQKGLLNDTIGKYIENLKLFLKWSFESKYHTNDSYLQGWFKQNQKSKKQEQEGKQDIVTLRIDEVFQLYNFDLTGNKRLERVRDLFCFMCFTLQRWSDAIRFDEKQIVRTQFGGEIVKAWNFKSYKTGKDITVPFVGDYMGKALQIAEKYKYLLPTISEQKFNSYIKEACKLAGLEREKEFKRYIGQREVIALKPLHEYISSHSGRRTGISILLNVYQMPIHFVRDLSGHSDLKTLDGYLEKDTNSLIGSLMKNTNGIGVSHLKIAR